MTTLQNAPLLKALRGERTSRTPMWFMRQAGRFLPEYREVRAKHRMLDVIRTPELASLVTLQPLDRFDLDAGIIFADILTPLIGMGVELDFVEGEGPKIFNPVKTHDDVKKLAVPAPKDNVDYTLEAIRLTTAKLTPRNIPLFGFSGAPFTLSAYLVEGTGSNGLYELKSFMMKTPEAFHALQEKLTELVSEYLVAQADAGASALQLFDSWLGVLGPLEFSTFAAPYLVKIISKVKSKTTVPLIYFAPGASGLLPHFKELGADAYGIDWRISLSQADKLLESRFPLQGNLDPACLAFGSKESLTASVQSILAEAKDLKGHVFNLGHGIIPQTPPENVTHVISAVRGR